MISTVDDSLFTVWFCASSVLNYGAKYNTRFPTENKYFFPLLAATDFTVTQERSAVMTFAQPITQVISKNSHAYFNFLLKESNFYQIYHSLFIKNPQGRPNYTAYTEPFHNMSWAVLFMIIVVAPPFLYAAVR